METMSPVRAWRERNGLSQQEAADELEVTKPTLSRWETGHRKISTRRLPTVSQKTRIPMAELRPDLAELIGDNQ